MHALFMALLLALSVLIIIAVLMQPSKTESSMASLSGGGIGNLFTNQKARGFEAFMQKVTAFLTVLFFIVGIALIYISAHK